MTEQLNPRTKRAYEALIRATLNLVSERTVDEVSITQIAEHANVSRPTVYKLFKNTGGLVAETAICVVNSVFEKLDDEFSDSEKDSILYIYTLSKKLTFAIYKNRVFFRNALTGSSGFQVAEHLVKIFEKRMENGFVGMHLPTEGQKAHDHRLAISGGAVWLFKVWLMSDFEGENAPEQFSKRLCNVLIDFSSASANLCSDDTD